MEFFAAIFAGFNSNINLAFPISQPNELPSLFLDVDSQDLHFLLRLDEVLFELISLLLELILLISHLFHLVAGLYFLQGVFFVSARLGIRHFFEFFAEKVALFYFLQHVLLLLLLLPF